MWTTWTFQVGCYQWPFDRASTLVYVQSRVRRTTNGRSSGYRPWPTFKVCTDNTGRWTMTCRCGAENSPLICNFRSRSPCAACLPLIPPVYLQHGLSMYPSFSRTFNEYCLALSNYDYRHEPRAVHSTPPLSSERRRRR